MGSGVHQPRLNPWVSFCDRVLIAYAGPGGWRNGHRSLPRRVTYTRGLFSCLPRIEAGKKIPSRSSEIRMARD
ncbi:MAG: hypothetical protein H6982_05955 [Chromatiales bacterium]|nr:hypothetical protein [Chromatiales bacterium]